MCLETSDDFVAISSAMFKKKLHHLNFSVSLDYNDVLTLSAPGVV